MCSGHLVVGQAHFEFRAVPNSTSFLGRKEEGGGKDIIVPENKGFLQRLKEVFWREEREGEEEGEGEKRRQEGS